MSGFAHRSVPEAVLRRARRGDPDAHAELFRVFSGPVFTLAARMTGSTAAAEDLLQESFEEVLRSIARFRGEASLATWIRQIAVSKCLMYLRSTWRQRATLFRDLGDDAAAEFADPAALSPADRALARDLERALARLPDRARIVVLLHDVEGYTHAEIAALTGLTESFSKSQLSRARARLRRVLDGYAQGEEAGRGSG